MSHLNLVEQLKQFVKNKKNKAHCDNSTLLKEFNLFEATHKRPYNLEMLYNALLTICPSSVEAERTFIQLDFFFYKISHWFDRMSFNAIVF